MATSTACETPLLARIRKCRKQPIMLHGRNHPRSNPARFRVYFAHISAKGAQGLPAILENVATTQNSTRAVERETPRPLLLTSPVRHTDNETGGLFRKLEARPPRSPTLRDEAPHLGHCQLPRNAIRGLPGILRRAFSSRRQARGHSLPAE